MFSPVGHGLDEERLIFGHGSAASFLGGVVDGEHVVAVHADGQHAVTRPAGGWQTGETNKKNNQM